MGVSHQNNHSCTSLVLLYAKVVKPYVKVFRSLIHPLTLLGYERPIPYMPHDTPTETSDTLCIAQLTNQHAVIKYLQEHMKLCYETALRECVSSSKTIQ
jgi:hypothetical protein